jgi:putative ABC transport system permease protein
MRQVKFIRHVRLGIKSLMMHKLRSFLTMLGVVFGVGSVVAMLSVGEGASQKAMRDIGRLGSNNIILTSIKPQEEQRTQSGGRTRAINYGLLYEDLERMKQSLPAIQRAVSAKLIRMEARLGSQAQEVRIVGTTPDWFELVPRQLIAGRVLTEDDMRTKAPVCVLAEKAARGLLATRHTLGQSITISGNAYIVVGIIRNKDETGEGGGGAQMPDQAIDAYIPLPVVRERIGDTVIQRATGSFTAEKVELHQIIVEVGDTPGASALDNVQPTYQAIKAVLERFHRKLDYEISVPLALLMHAREQRRMFNIVLGSIAGISLLVGGIGIMNIMLASVTERTREIGVRRAIGAKRRQIIGQFLIETVVLSIIGGLIGVGLGVSIPYFIEKFANMPTVVTLWSVTLSLGISAAVGIIFGLYPAYRAAMLDPIVALRHE